ncbi:hypothetical protein [Flavobacterium coralii]|uniref:hypothetical protein n=1 Tax=Flavobacterium coralii TaxID=2838017 RepID=UPI000C60D052|nr:hypothetical protein [Flavobacterium sp.]|tara:strand:+ start:46325 stop:46621 length:297 start_codon:yes stop_codon:yes gene_type:complete
MSRLDYKHTAFHILIAVYFIWFAITGTLIGMALINLYDTGNTDLNPAFTAMLLLNLVMGTVLFAVIRLFRNRTLLGKVVKYSYVFMAGTCLTTMLMIR